MLFLANNTDVFIKVKGVYQPAGILGRGQAGKFGVISRLAENDPVTGHYTLPVLIVKPLGIDQSAIMIKQYGFQHGSTPLLTHAAAQVQVRPNTRAGGANTSVTHKSDTDSGSAKKQCGVLS